MPVVDTVFHWPSKKRCRTGAVPCSWRLTVHVEPSSVPNLTIFHCLENSQPNLTGLNQECDKGELEFGRGQYVANVTSGNSVVLKVRVGYAGSITEPVSIKWLFFAEGEEFLSEL